LIACIGRVTKQHIENAGFSVFFAGEEAGNAPEVALKLKAQIGSKSLLVLRSDKSYRSIPKAFSSEQCTELVVYQTQLSGQNIKSNPDIVAFTSPSTAEALVADNVLETHRPFIALCTGSHAFLEAINVPLFQTLSTS